jgi:4-amino-4-deoxy-L-arabinose transferase-like glycosyltransferase
VIATVPAVSSSLLHRLVLAASAVLFVWGLGSHDLWAPDEPYFAEGAREMVADGQWIVPHVNGVVTTDKPPLFFWLIALCSLAFGEVTSFTARLPSALAALGTVAITLRLGERFFDARTAALAGSLLATIHMFWERARWAHIDSLLCCLVWVALAAFAAFRAGDARGARAGLLFWVAAALAVLAKGPVGVLLPLGIALVTLAGDRQLGRWRSFAPIAGPLAFAAIVGAWIGLVALAGPAEYSVWGALREHFVDRAIYGMHHEQPFWYYLHVAPVKLLPWTGLLAGAVVLAWRRRAPFDRFLLVAALFVIVFFSISTEKRTLYILPAFPAFALMMGSFVGELAGWSDSPGEPAWLGRRWLTAGHGVVVAILAAAGLALPFASLRVDEVELAEALILGVILLGSAAAAVLCLRRRRLPGFVVAPAVGVALVYLIVVSAIYPRFEPRKSARSFALRIRAATAESIAAGRPLLSYKLGNIPEPIAFYTDGLYTTEVWGAAEVDRHFARSEQVFALVDGDFLDELDPETVSELYLVDRTLLSRKNVLLLTNRASPGAVPVESVHALGGAPSDEQAPID